jgi:hypothetical protein
LFFFTSKRICRVVDLSRYLVVHLLIEGNHSAR